ncbi:MAG: mannose-1-phosphate guanylyltransferase [Planctomycetota bacterium]|jgi:mannose-1-phosphate guanylyltransferase
MEHLYAVIMAGGSGTRFWPASRRSKPKQFLAIGAPSPLLAVTVRRLEGLIPPERILVVTAAAHADLVREVCPEIPAENVLAEPTGRNTLPCVAWASAELLRRDPESIHVVLPADHVVEPADEFRACLAAAARAAEAARSSLFTLGVTPTHPATGFGYIHCGESLGQSDGREVLRVESFVEKPPLARAEAFLEQGGYLWNSGMFVWSGQAIAGALREHAPETWKAVEHADQAAVSELYPSLPSQSVDTGLMERWNDVRVLPISFGWSDVGAWTALPEVLPQDDEQNTASGGAQLLAEDSSGCVVHGEAGELIALLGVHDLVVVHAGGTTLVCPKDRAQEVRKLVERCATEAPEKLL